MATMTYKEQLLHPNWQRKRLEILQRDEFRCQACMETENTLHVHHKRYVKGRMVWEYPGVELVTLCATCHEANHLQSEAFKEMLAQLPVDGPGCNSNAMAVLAGWANGEQGLDFTRFFNEDPHNYVVGEVANRLSWALRMDELMDLLHALGKAPVWVVRRECGMFTETLIEKAGEPKPPGYGELLL